jgi:two-component system NarL family sensor kinase
VRELRSLLVTIVPPALHAQGLRTSLSDLAAGLEGRGITVTVDVEDVGPLDQSTEALIYRAAQEGVRNVARHAEAGAVWLTLAREGDDRVRLTVRDDGRGLAPGHDEARRRGSVGLELLGQLVGAQGGALVVRDADGRGTELVVVLPTAAVPAAPELHPVPERTR